MNKKAIGIIVAVLLIIAGAVGGYFAGKSTETAKYKEAQELNIALSKSELDALGEIEGPIYVTGHKSPDADTVGSSIAYAELLTKLGYDARPVVLGEINNETKYILEAAGVEAPKLLEDASGCKMVLVDHSDYEQSAEGLQDARIISIIDHHGDGSVRTGNQLIYDARPLGATATIIWMRFRNYGLEPDRQTAHIMIGSIFSDTHNLEYDSATFADKEAVKSLAKLAGLTDLSSFWQGMHAASLSYEGMTDEDVFFNDYKEYECAGKNYGIGCMKAVNEEGARDLAERMTQVMSDAVESTGMDFVISQISINEGDVSIAYFVPSNDMAKAVLEAAFGDATEFDGTSFIMTPSVSRKSVVVPAITDVLKKDEGAEAKSVDNQEMTLNLTPFGERSGKYTGEMLNDLPQGSGKFESQNAEGTGWIYEGEWVNGQFDGEGYLYWPSNGQKFEGTYSDSDLIEGKGYIRDTLAYEGDFTSYKFDGEGTFYNHKGEEVYTGPFTAGAPSDQDAFIAATRDIHYDDYAKDMETYRADPVRFKGEIIQLWEDDGSGVRNYVVSLDDSNEQLLFIYDYRMRLGLDVELQESDIITGYGLTTAAFTYDSKSGTSVTSPAVFTYFVE